jgi:uncharacterized protein YhaN
MRIDELRLRAWGPFTRLVLDLSAGQHGLHLVLGPNEAGKSSALRAVNALLFGGGTRCVDAFLHDAKALRVGALLRSAKGELLSVTRSPGIKKDTLLDDSGQPLPEAAMAAVLGGMAGELFGSLFGINHEALRGGARDLLNASGDLGQAIVAASTGYRDLKAVLDGLEKEALDLFKPGRGKLPRVNGALAQLKDARAKVDLATVKWSRYDEVRKAIEKGEEEREAVAGELTQARAAASRLGRVRDAFGPVRERTRVLEELRSLGEVVALPGDFASDRKLRQQLLETAREESRAASRELSAIEASLQALQVPSALLEQGSAISALLKELGGHDKAQRDRRTLKTRLEQSEEDARAILKELGRGPSLADADAVRLPTALRARLAELGHQHAVLRERRETAGRTVSELDVDLDRARGELDRLGPSTDLSRLREALEAALAQGDLDSARGKAAQALQDDEAQAAADLRKLGLWPGPLAQARSLPVPSEEVVDQHAVTFGALQDEARDLKAKQQQAEAERARIDGQLRELQLTAAVPTEHELMTARDDRGRLWSGVRQAWQQGTAYDAQPCDAHERAVQRADDVADRMRRESDRVAAQANLMAARATSDESVARLRAAAAELELRTQSWQGEWKAAWAPAAIVPQLPVQMRAWLQRLLRLAEQAVRVERRARELSAVEQAIGEHRRALTEALEAAGETSPAGEVDLASVLRRARRVAERVDRVEQERRRLAATIEERARKKATVEASLATADGALTVWRGDWVKTMQDVGLAASTLPAEASAVVSKMEDLIKKVDEAAGYRRRIADIERDASAFDREVAELVHRVAPDLSGLPASQAVAALDARHKEASTNATRREGLEKQRDARAEQLRSAGGTIEQCEQELARMCLAAGGCSAPDLPVVEQRHAQATTLTQRLATLEARLLPLASGADIARFVEEVEREDSDTVLAQIADTDRRVLDCDRRLQAIEQDIGARKQERRQVDGGFQAAEAAEGAQSILAQIRDATERYLRVRLSSALLRREIEAYRRAHQAPVLRRASELFRTLTCGSFVSLRPVYEKSDPVIAGVRPSDDEVPVGGMSDGTRDQLYLSLRLASIERYVASNEPVPFIVDDIFVHFDDRRSSAALEVLADLSRQVQVIVFTHHPHLLTLARGTRASEVLFEHHLGE